MQQALDALIRCATDIDAHWECRSIDQIDAAGVTPPIITALRERLAHCDRCGKRLGGEGDIHTCTPDPIGDAQDRLIAEIAAQPEQEPVDADIASILACRDMLDAQPVPPRILMMPQATQPAAQQESVATVGGRLRWDGRFVLEWGARVSVGDKLYKTPPAQPAAAQPEQEPVAWRNAAIRIGEELSSVGPDGYYNMTAAQWLDWALEQQPRGKNSLTTPPAAQPEPMRLYVEDFARRCGWKKDSGEGAFEYVQRKSYAQGLEDATPPAAAKQESIAELLKQSRANFDSNFGKFGQGWADWIYSDLLELLTTPPAAQRTWVGLTKYEAAECWYGKNCLEQRPPFDGYTEAIEAKLKEKNT
jgi:hypothetical protein